jgi:hypothetical protein
LFEGKRKKYFVFVRYKVQDNFCLTTYELDDDDIAFALPLTAASEVICKNKLDEQFSPLMSTDRVALLAAQR